MTCLRFWAATPFVLAGDACYWAARVVNGRRVKQARTEPKPRPRASWDDREDSTWIDKI